MENTVNTKEVSELTDKTNEWVCLIAENNAHWKCTTTKFHRNPGDIMNIDGKKWKVISSEGDRNCMIAVMNHHVSMYNNGKRFNYWNK